VPYKGVRRFPVQALCGFCLRGIDFFTTMGYIGIRENPKNREKQRLSYNMAYNAL
jgi:hypothetical protein